MSETDCPLCSAPNSAIIASNGGRSFHQCPACRLVFVPANQHISAEEAVLRYRKHRNSPDDAAYVAFLRRLADPVVAHLPTGSQGLDFGCGPAPVLGAILCEAGYPTRSYDPNFFPDQSILESTFDFVTCSEVAEHVAQPLVLFAQLRDRLRAGGTIAVMTQLYDGVAGFEQWWYARDPTHVSFFCLETMTWIADRFGWTLSQRAPNVVLFAV